MAPRCLAPLPPGSSHTALLVVLTPDSASQGVTRLYINGRSQPIDTLTPFNLFRTVHSEGLLVSNLDALLRPMAPEGVDVGVVTQVPACVQISGAKRTCLYVVWSRGVGGMEGYGGARGMLGGGRGTGGASPDRRAEVGQLCCGVVPGVVPSTTHTLPQGLLKIPMSTANQAPIDPWTRQRYY